MKIVSRKSFVRAASVNITNGINMIWKTASHTLQVLLKRCKKKKKKPASKSQNRSVPQKDLSIELQKSNLKWLTKIQHGQTIIESLLKRVFLIKFQRVSKIRRQCRHIHVSKSLISQRLSLAKLPLRLNKSYRKAKLVTKIKKFHNRSKESSVLSESLISSAKIQIKDFSHIQTN